MSHDEKRPLKVLYYLLVAASASALFLLLLNFTFGSITEEAGQFGDFFGGMLNPILTFLTFFGLIATIVIQKQELKSARIEYERTATALSTQAIETTFFNILDLHHKLADNLTIDLSNLRPGYQKIVPHVIEGLTGKAAQTLFNGRSSFEATLDFLTTGPQAPDSAINVYLNIQKNHNHVFGHYFRNLYQALKVIDSYSETLLPDSDKRKYTSILRAQLSTSELAILMINCVDNVCDQGQF